MEISRETKAAVRSALWGAVATMPGSTEPNSAVAKACAESLDSKKAVELRG